MTTEQLLNDLAFQELARDINAQIAKELSFYIKADRELIEMAVCNSNSKN